MGGGKGGEGEKGKKEEKKKVGMEREFGVIGNNGWSRCSPASSGGRDEGEEVIKELTEANELIAAIGGFSGFRKTQSKECLNLVRRLKMLVPLLEEIRDLHNMVPAEALSPHLAHLKEALVLAKRLLKNCHNGSKIYLVSLFVAFHTDHTNLLLHAFVFSLGSLHLV